MAEAARRTTRPGRRTKRKAAAKTPHLRVVKDLLEGGAAAPPGATGPQAREPLRAAVEAGIPSEAVRLLQARLKELGVPRPSAYVEAIASRASRARRDRLTQEEGERLVRVASVLARTLDVWEDEAEAAKFLTTPHPELGMETPLDRALSEIGARQVEDLLLRLDLGLPV